MVNKCCTTASYCNTFLDTVHHSAKYVFMMEVCFCDNKYFLSLFSSRRAANQLLLCGHTRLCKHEVVMSFTYMDLSVYLLGRMCYTRNICREKIRTTAASWVFLRATSTGGQKSGRVCVHHTWRRHAQTPTPTRGLQTSGARKKIKSERPP